MNTRRQFLIRAPLGFLASAVACRNEVQSPGSPSTPGAPPTFGTGTGSGPDVSPATFAEAEKLIEALNALHPDEMSPRDALEALYALKAKLPKL